MNRPMRMQSFLETASSLRFQFTSLNTASVRPMHPRLDWLKQACLFCLHNVICGSDWFGFAGEDAGGNAGVDAVGDVGEMGDAGGCAGGSNRIK